MIVLLSHPYLKTVTVNDSLTSKRLDICLRENFPELSGYCVLTKSQFKVLYACLNHGMLITLTHAQIIDCFAQWLDAVENSGVSVEDNNTFKAAFVDSLNDYKDNNND